MGGAEPAVGVGRAVGLALDEVLAVEVELDVVRGPVELHHHVLDLAGLAVPHAGGGHGLEPVAVGVGTAVDGPVAPSGFRTRCGGGGGNGIEERRRRRGRRRGGGTHELRKKKIEHQNAKSGGVVVSQLDNIIICIDLSFLSHSPAQDKLQYIFSLEGCE